MKAWLWISVVISLVLHVNYAMGGFYYDLIAPFKVHKFGWPFIFSKDDLIIFISMVSFGIYFFMAYMGGLAFNEVTKGTPQPDNDLDWGIPLMLVYGAYVIYLLSFGIVLASVESDGFAQFFLALLSIPFMLYSWVFMLFGPTIFTLSLLYALPLALIYVYSLLITSKTVEVTEKFIAQKRPDNEVLKELSEVIKKGDKTDLEIVTIVEQLSPSQRFLHTLTYKKKAEKYREVRRVMDAQTEAINNSEELVDSAIELQRARNNDR